MHHSWRLEHSKRRNRLRHHDLCREGAVRARSPRPRLPTEPPAPGTAAPRSTQDTEAAPAGLSGKKRGKDRLLTPGAKTPDREGRGTREQDAIMFPRPRR